MTMSNIHDEGTPALIYHVVESERWREACAKGVEYLPPTYETDGFIHATHDGRLLIDVLNHFYKEKLGEFLCLELDTAALISPVKMESAAGVGDKPAHESEEKFPHIYGPIAPLGCVVRQLPVKRTEDGTFLAIENI
jgi:uncharacterized protein (DUF952 family)